MVFVNSEDTGHCSLVFHSSVNAWRCWGGLCIHVPAPYFKEFVCFIIFFIFLCVCVRYNYILNNWLQSNLEKLEINAMAVSLSVAIITNPGGPRYAQRV